MVLNNQNLYDPVRIAWAKNNWSAALATMLEGPVKGTKEHSYLCNLDVVSLISEAEVLSETGKKEIAINLYKTWLLESQSQLNYAIYFNLGVYLTQENRIEDAKEAYQKSILANPNFAFSIENLNKLSDC